jgi:integrase
MLHNALSPMKVKHLDSGKFADGRGLWLQKRNKIAGKWFLRIIVNGKRREMGLGSWPDVSIAEARDRAKTARRLVRDGLDPIEERNKNRRQPKRLSVEQAIQECFEARRAELKNNGRSGRWLTPLRLHIIPKIGKLPIEDVDQHVLCDAFRPIWHDKPDTARKAMNRINLTLKHAAALDLDVDLQAVMKMQALLGKRRHKVKHIPALPYSEAPEFYQMLCDTKFMSTLALRLLMLTLARTSEIRLARFVEIDDDIWTLRPDRTKTNREHRIPLTEEALKVIKLAREYNDTDYLFPSTNGKPLSDVAMSVFMKREGYKARPHGFRATFRTWAENETDADWETKEAALYQ